MTFETWFQSIHADIPVQSANAVLKLTEEGGTIPFIARYRKEVTGGLDEEQIRQLQAGWKSLTALEDRRATILQSLQEQGISDPALTQAIEAAETLTALELKHFAVGLVKGTVYGALVAYAGCLRGMQCGRSAQAVGESTTSAVVLGILLITISASVLTIVFHKLGI